MEEAKEHEEPTVAEGDSKEDEIGEASAKEQGETSKTPSGTKEAKDPSKEDPETGKVAEELDFSPPKQPEESEEPSKPEEKAEGETETPSAEAKEGEVELKRG